MLAYRHLHDGRALLWHAPGKHPSDTYYHFKPANSGARVQRVTQEVAEQVASPPAQVCLHLAGHPGCRRLQCAPDAVASAVQLLESEEGVYYAVDGVEPFTPLAFRYLILRFACSCLPGSLCSCQVSCRWSQAVVAALPDAEEYRWFLRTQPSTVVPIILPLWSRNEVLDLQKVAYAGILKSRYTLGSQ